MHASSQTETTVDTNRGRPVDVAIVEVGPRDGLQNEALPIPTDTKIAFVDALSRSGLTCIEATSFVSPKAVPQLADANELMSSISRAPGVRYPCLVPNMRGFERALRVGVDAIALFTSASEAFAAANVGSSIDGTFERFAPVLDAAQRHGVWVRGYVSVAFGCPYAGKVSPEAAISVVERLFVAGCAEVSVADTISIARPETVASFLDLATDALPIDRLAMHFHDTSGAALDNVECALAFGIRTFDAAVGGLGGCPFAPGAPGNLSTELLVGRLEQLGLHTGVELAALETAKSMVAPYVQRLQQTPA